MHGITQILSSACNPYPYLHGISVDQRLVVYGPGPLGYQLGGEVAIWAGETLVVVVGHVVLTSKTALGSRGNRLGAEGWCRSKHTNVLS